MILGIHKRQWPFILAAVACVLLLNLEGMRREVLANNLRWERISESATESGVSLEILASLYRCTYPWREIALEILGVGLSLAVLAWLVVWLSRRAFFQRVPLGLRVGIEVALALGVGVAFAAASIAYAFHWYDDFWCRPMYGLAYPRFVYLWSQRFVFPAASALTFLAMMLSNRGSVESLSRGTGMRALNT